MASTTSTAHFEEIVANYQAKLYDLARRMTRNRQDAEDIVQEAFLRAYVALNAMSEVRRREVRLSGWLYTITLNLARTYLRRRPPQSISIDASELSERLSAQHVDFETPETVFDRRAAIEEVEEMLLCVPEGMRDAARLRFVEGRTHAEIAKAIRQPIGTVKSHVHRAVVVMRRVLAAQKAAVAA